MRTPHLAAIIRVPRQFKYAPEMGTPHNWDTLEVPKVSRIEGSTVATITQ